MSGDELRNLDEVAERLRVSRRTVEREHAKGRITFTKIGGSTFVLESELARYIAAAQRKHAA